MARVIPTFRRAIGLLVVAVAVVLAAACLIESIGGTGDPGTESVLAQAYGLELRGDYEEAERVLREALIRVGTATVQGELVGIRAGARRAWMLLLLSRYTEADSFLTGLLPIAEAAAGSDSVEILPVLNLSGRAKFALGRYRDAESFYLRAMSIARKSGGSESPLIAPAFQGMADVYHKLRRIGEADLLAKKAHRILSKDAGTSPLHLARALSTCATVRRGCGEYDPAERLYKEALEIATKAGGAAHPAAGVIHNQLAALYINVRRLQEAEQEAQAARSIISAKSGPGHIEFANSAYHLATVRGLEGRMPEAEPLFREALSLKQSFLGQDHPDVAGIYDYAGFSYRLAGRFDDAIEASSRAVEIRLKDFINNGGHLKDQASVLYSQAVFYTVSDFIAYYFDSPHKTAAQTQMVADAILSCKGIALDGLLLQQAALRECGHPEALRLRRRLETIRFLTSAHYFKDPMQADFAASPTIDSLRAAEEEVLVALSGFTHEARSSGLARRITAGDIQTHLPSGSCLVEFFSYLYVDPVKTYNESTRYGALVIDKPGIRCLTDLANAQRIDTLLRRHKDLLGQRIAGSVMDQDNWRLRFDTVLTALCEEIWDPIARSVAPSQVVLISTDGALTELSFACLRDKAERFLVEDHVFGYLNGGRDLLRHRAPGTGNDALFALGDPDFDASPDLRMGSIAGLYDDSDSNSHSFSVRSAPTTCEEFAALNVSRLPGTRRELKGIAEAWRRSGGDSLAIFEAESASEEAIRRVAPGHRVIHLATHGFFMPEECGPQFVGTEGTFEPAGRLLSSGILLAGANIRTGRPGDAQVEDGILTAEEVSSLDFRETDLIVLSACETGLGEYPRGSGSPLGLRRAFQIAGVRTVVSALWPISDQITVETMRHLYSDLKRPPAELLREYAIGKINDARSHGENPDPYQWAPFIASGEFKPR